MNLIEIAALITAFATLIKVLLTDRKIKREEDIKTMFESKINHKCAMLEKDMGHIRDEIHYKLRHLNEKLLANENSLTENYKEMRGLVMDLMQSVKGKK